MSIKSLTNLEQDRFGFKTIFHVFMGIFLFIAINLIFMSSLNFIYVSDNFGYIILATIFQSIAMIFLFIILMRIYIIKILKLQISDFRICKPHSFLPWILCAVALPVGVVAFFVFFIPGTLSVSTSDSYEAMDQISYAVFMACLSSGITEELLFRGFVMYLLEKRWNIQIAAVIPSIIFGLLHIHNMINPNLFDIILLTVAGTSVGVMFSVIAFRSGSIWSSAIVHGLWNLIIVGGIIDIGINPTAVLYLYTLHSDSLLITGGTFGIESSLPAMIGYIVVILLVFCKRCVRTV